MQLTFKHIVLALLIIAIIYFITRNNNIEGLEQDEQQEIINKITFNADDFLKNLTEEDAKKMLVSNQIMPWVKFMKDEEAEVVYNEIFKKDDNKDVMLKDILSNILDKEVGSYLPESADDLVGLYNKVKNELKLNTSKEINDYGEQFGFEKTDEGLKLPSNEELIMKIGDFLENDNNDFNKDLKIEHSESKVEIPSKNLSKADSKKMLDLGININEINLQNFPNVLKYRVRNNRNFVANSIANIMNSIAFKKGLDWKKVNVGGKIITDTTANPNNVLILKKSKCRW
jgi:hypothetical protein